MLWDSAAARQQFRIVLVTKDEVEIPSFFLERSTMNSTYIGLHTRETRSVAGETQRNQTVSGQGPAQMPPVPLSTVVTIGPHDNPQQMPQLAPLLTDSVARLARWPFQPPTGQPGLITRDDYLRLIKTDF